MSPAAYPLSHPLFIGHLLVIAFLVKLPQVFVRRTSTLSSSRISFFRYSFQSSHVSGRTMDFMAALASSIVASCLESRRQCEIDPQQS